MITGDELERAALTTGAGVPFPVVILRPAPTLEQVTELRRQSDAWLALAKRYEAEQIAPEVAFRAHFASEVLFYAAVQLTTPYASAVLLAVHDDEVVGVALYHLEGEDGQLAWVTVHPRFLAGSPTPAAEQVRGIGSELVCVATAELVRGGATRVRLTPLDAAAARFWSARGFAPGRSDELSVEGSEAITRMAAACSSDPDDPASDACPMCGSYRSLREVRLPALRERMPA